MNREIKFRAWWPSVKKFKYFVPGNYEDTPSGWAMTFIQEGGGGSIYLGKSEIMQFTGLKDRNGKEIYEGDVVIAIEMGIDENFMPSGEVWSQRNAEVYWDGLIAGWALRAESFERGCEPMTHLDSFEVIGNIYETPEFLNSVRNPEPSVATEVK